MIGQRTQVHRAVAAPARDAARRPDPAPAQPARAVPATVARAAGPGGPAVPAVARPGGAADEMAAASRRRVADPAGGHGGVVMRACAECAAEQEAGHQPGACCAGDHARDADHGAGTGPGGVVMRACSSCAPTRAAPPAGTCSSCAAGSSAPAGRGAVLARVAAPGAGQQVPAAVAGRIDALRGGGEPLGSDLLDFFEPRFGADLGAVRLHTGPEDARLAAELDAKAFTIGNDVFFGAGQYQPASTAGRRLLAHELAHTLQQQEATSVSRQGMGVTEPDDDVEREAERIAEDVVAGRSVGPPRVAPGPETVAGDWFDDRLAEARQTIGSATDLAVETATDLGETVAEVGEAAYEGAVYVGTSAYEGAVYVGQTAVEGITWLATEAGGLALAAANELVGLLGGTVTVTDAGLVVTLPDISFCPTLTTTIALPGASRYVPLVGGGLTVGPVTVIGSVGLNFGVSPSLTAVVGPCVLKGVKVTINPVTASASAQGTVSVGAAASALAVGRASVRGQVDVIAVVPVGGVPVPVKMTAAALDVGGQLALRLTGGGTVSQTVAVSYTPGQVSLSVAPAIALGGAIDLDIAAFGRLEFLEANLCTFVWPLWHWDASIAHQWTMPVTVDYGGTTGITVGDVISTPIPFEEAVTGIDRSPPSTQCPLVDQICVIMRQLGLLPSQKGVGWKGHPPPPVPNPCNSHPDAPYVEDPLIPSGALCRGVCGPDCAKSCTPEPDIRRCSEAPGGMHFICVYKGVQTCGTHDGCRHHDACYDWCAAGGDTSIFDSCHRWCDMGCACEYPLDTCVGWALGNPPFDGWMTFYDETVSIMLGPFPGPCPAIDVVGDRVQRYLDLVEPVAIVTALAEAPLEERLHLGADPLAVEQLEQAIGPVLWPTARRILDGAASVTVPSLDEATVWLADRAIRGNDHQRAFDVVIATLMARGLVSTATASWSHVPRRDRGEGLTIFNLVEDPNTHERRATAPVRVEIYTPAFADVGWLFSTIMHEQLHVAQVLAGYSAAEFDPTTGRQQPEFVARDEVEAYLWEIEHAVGTGLATNVAQMEDVGRRLTSQFNRMTPALQARYRVRYDLAQQRVRDVAAGRGPMPIDEARRILEETNREIQELLRDRPSNPEEIDRQIDAIRRRRAQAMITVALVDNPAVEVVRPGDPGTYRVATVDADGRVRYVYGGISVAWHLAPVSPSAFTLGGALGAGGQMAVAGTAVQGRVHPFPPDVDFDEHIHVVANTIEEAGQLAAARIVGNIRRISGGPRPGRPDVEFRHLLTFPRGGGFGIKMGLGQVLAPGAEIRLGRAIAALNGGNMNTFWRGFLADGRFTPITKVIFVTAERPDGTELIAQSGNADFNLAYIADPGEVPETSLGEFAWQMCCSAMDQARKGNWLKAAKRAYNYFSTVGDTAHMAALEPVFRRPETAVEPWATVIDAIQLVLDPNDMRVRQPRTRIMTVDEARAQVDAAATAVEDLLPDTGTGTSPRAIARDLRVLATFIRARNSRGHVEQSRSLAASFGREAAAIRTLISAGLKGQVEPVVRGVLEKICPNKKDCDKRK